MKIGNKDNSSWEVLINNPVGYINHITDKKRLIEKLKGEIKSIIDMDEQGEFCINNPFLDLSNRQNNN